MGDARLADSAALPATGVPPDQELRMSAAFVEPWDRPVGCHSTLFQGLGTGLPPDQELRKSGAFVEPWYRPVGCPSHHWRFPGRIALAGRSGQWFGLLQRLVCNVLRVQLCVSAVAAGVLVHNTCVCGCALLLQVYYYVGGLCV